MKNIRIAIGADHAGFIDKEKLIKYLVSLGCRVTDCGAESTQPSDYPDYSFRVAKAVASGRCDRGVLVCGTGNGMAIAANKVKGIRAAVCWSQTIGKLASEHNWANVLCLPSRFVNLERCKKITKAWLTTPPATEGRHERRVKKIIKFESNC